MPRLLGVHHTPSPSLEAMLQGVLDGTADELLEGVEVVVRPALEATAADVLDADGYVLGTPAYLGYMSGALKHFFDSVYLQSLEHTTSRPLGVYVHGNTDVDGALLGIERIVAGLGWREVHRPVTVIGKVTDADRERCGELAATVAANLL
ncbi:NAD(P)H-dependent oxidoreductase [soil metagenome]